jgi:hypothetical protein
MTILRRPAAWAVLVLLLGLPCARSAPLRLLLLTGANNHDWRATTPVLKAILEHGALFAVDVETNVAAMQPAAFRGYDAVLSNFNTFGLKPPGAVWNPEMRRAFVAFIRAGHGLVVVHAGSAVFYDWPEFQQIAGVTWGQATHHGKLHTNEVAIVTSDHPITAGLRAFETFDEFWQNAPVAPGAQVLATVTPRPEFGGSGRPEPMALATEFGAGRGFTLLLGHNPQAMASPASSGSCGGVPNGRRPAKFRKRWQTHQPNEKTPPTNSPPFRGRTAPGGPAHGHRAQPDSLARAGRCQPAQPADSAWPHWGGQSGNPPAEQFSKCGHGHFSGHL